MTGLPVTLSIADRPCLVVGAGRAGRRKLAALLAAGAAVTVVDPRPAAANGDGQPPFTQRQRRWQAGDSGGMFLTVVATDDPAVNEAAASDAGRAGALVLRADRPEAGDVSLPAVHRRGRLSVAVSTGGASPTLAALLRDRLAGHSVGWDELVDWAEANRPVSEADLAARLDRIRPPDPPHDPTTAAARSEPTP